MGGYSQIKAELVLLSTAASHENYDYYHLLTGADLPLKSQDEILNFYDKCNHKDFISCDENDVEKRKIRLMYYYPLQDKLAKESLVRKIFQHSFTLLQKEFHIDRLKNQDLRLGIGSPYFDITDSTVRLILSKADSFENIFKNTICADEMYVPTILLSANEYNFDNTYEYHGNNLLGIEQLYLNVMRAINFDRGEHKASPYIWHKTDVPKLLESGMLFARKFSTEVDKEAIDEVFERVMKT